MTTKLTLSIDDAIVRRAKRHAREHGTSLSGLVSRFLALVPAGADAQQTPRALRSLRGLLTRGDREAHRRHLREKYL
jgi:hypothetical protein